MNFHKKWILIKEKIESLVKQGDVVETKKTTTRKPRAKKTTTETEDKKTTNRKPTAKKPVVKKTTTTRKPRVKKVEESSEDNK